MKNIDYNKENPYHPAFYILDSWHKLSWLVRVRDVVLTIFVWFVYFYFMRDFVIFMQDLFTWTAHGFQHIELYKGLASLKDVVWFVDVSTCIASLLIGWSLYNVFRFGNKTRRRPSIPVEPEELAKSFGFDVSFVNQWQNTRIMTVHHHPDGRIRKITKGLP